MDTSNDDWNVDCSDDEKYEIKSKWVTVGVRSFLLPFFQVRLGYLIHFFFSRIC